MLRDETRAGASVLTEALVAWRAQLDADVQGTLDLDDRLLLEPLVDELATTCMRLIHYGVDGGDLEVVPCPP